MWRKANDLLPICFEKWNFTIGFAKKKKENKSSLFATSLVIPCFS